MTPAGICSSRFPYWYMYVDDELGLTYRESLERTLSFRYDFRAAIAAKPSPRRFLRTVRDAAHFLKCRFRSCRPLVKDPLALLSAEWLAGTFDMNVLVMVRHPAAFAASLKVKRRTFPFEDLANQRSLMRDFPARFTVEIHEYVMDEPDVIDQAILLWRILHYQIDRYRQRHHDWFFARHEDLARDPIRSFADLYLALGLAFTALAEGAVMASSTGPAVGQALAASGMVRDSRMSIRTCGTRLSASEIERVREGVSDIRSRFYAEDEWLGCSVGGEFSGVGGSMGRRASGFCMLHGWWAGHHDMHPLPGPVLARQASRDSGSRIPLGAIRTAAWLPPSC